MFTHAQFSTSLMLWYNMETFSALVTLYVEGPITDGFPTQRSSDAMRMPICDICPHEDFLHFVAPLALEQSSQVAKPSISKLHGSTSLQKIITNKKWHVTCLHNSWKTMIKHIILELRSFLIYMCYLIITRTKQNVDRLTVITCTRTAREVSAEK